MAVTEVLRGLGSWSVQLTDDVPKSIMDKLKYFGHIAVNNGRVNPVVAGDALLSSSRYVGVFRGRGKPVKDFTLHGVGMAFWLGDEDGKGEVIEDRVSYEAATFTSVITDLLPSSVHVGTIFGIAPTFTGTFQLVDPRTAIDYVCQTLGAEWRVNGNATLDAGLESDLFRVNPVAALIRNRDGVDLFTRAYAGSIETAQDVEDFTTRVVLVAQNDGDAFVTADADISPGLNPFLDLWGNTVKLTRVASESTTDSSNADARAALLLNRFSGSRDAISLSTNSFDLKGDAQVGDYLWVFDPEAGIQDLANEVNFMGSRIYPMKLRLLDFAWPIVKGMSVSFRTETGEWLDLTPYLKYETGSSSLKVGGYNRSLIADTDPGGVIGTRPQPNTSIPGVPTWVTPFTQSVYLSPVTGNTRAQVELKWTRPENTDGTTILDGDHYEIRYRTGTTPIFPVTWAQLSTKTWAQLSTATWQNPLQYTATEWSYAFVPFDKLTMLLVDLVPSMPYEAQIRAVDGGTPANAGAWSTLTTWQTSGDTIAPSAPAAPTAAASTLNVQIKHTLGKASGGTYNLELDLNHLEVHGGADPGFSPSVTTLLGRALVNHGSITGQIPLVASFPIDSLTAVYFKVIAVDNSGNKSSPSVAVSSTALLVDDAHITNLTVSKLTAGTMTANVLLASEIYTGVTGARIALTSIGMYAYDSNNVQVLKFDIPGGGDMMIQGTLQTGSSNTRIVVNPEPDNWPRIDIYPSASTNHITLCASVGTDPRGNSAPGMLLQSENASRVVIGGYLNFAPTGVYLGSNYGSASTHGYYWIDDNGRHNLRGRFIQNQFDSYSGLIVGQSGYFGAGNVGVAISYGITMASTMQVLSHGYLDSIAAGQNYWASSGFPGGSSTTGFTAIFIREPVLGNIGNAVGGYLNYWAFRI